ncbi:rhodanese-like domain-containing protein [Ravibacter arvi]|uniref:Rhodanese-like domain-containing protein n=1 Tax=Ravibacter arvi TaxID=2051041 RepID=A0ABP8LUX7_9BACT
MFSFLKKLFASPDQALLKEAVREGALLVDVRSPGEFASGSVKGAVNIPLGSIEKEIDRFKGKRSVVVFCASGARSGSARKVLERNGIQNVLNGGTWRKVGAVVA